MKRYTKKEKTAIIFVAISAIFASFGQIFYKYAANYFNDIHSFIFNPFLYLSIITYGVGLIFLLKGIKEGELTKIYPIMATSFIWVSLLSPIFFKTDSMSLNKWTGVLIIILGISFMGGKRKNE